MASAASSIAVVQGEFTAAQLASERQGAMTYYRVVTGHLAAAGIAFDGLKDSDVVAGRLAGYRLAILPYNAVVPDNAAAQLLNFVDQGGKLIAFYTLAPKLRPRFGVEFVGHQRAGPEGRFAAMKFKSGLVAGVPNLVTQSSWNINWIKPTSPQTRVLAEWLDRSGASLGAPAWVLAPCGAWMSHVLTDSDPANKRRLLLALVGHFVPEVWPQTAQRAVQQIGQVDRWQSLPELARAIDAAGLGFWSRYSTRRVLREAYAAQARATNLLAARQFIAALEAAQAAQAKAREVFYRIQPSRTGEFRGVWIHSGFGIEAWGWDKTVRALKENGFNAIFPNLLWGGLAHYPSTILPTSETARAKGDQLADCLKACRRHGVELHLWKVNHNLAHAPASFVASLRAADRTQRSKNGEPIDWLCPSHPENFALERDSMLEIARRYDVQGLHFDYIRYPHADACFCHGCRIRFEQAAGVQVPQWPGDVLDGPLAAPFGDWRRAQITRLVQAVSDEARKLKPKIKISAAVFGDWTSSRHRVGQDWKAWVEAGYLDFVCPMDYDTNDENVAALVRRQVGWVNQRIPLYIGLGAYRMAAPEQLIRQIQLTRTHGAQGFVLFQHDATLAKDFLPALRLGVTALPPR